MSYDNNNLTTDAVPGAPRKIVPDILHQEFVSEQKKYFHATDETDQKAKLRLDPTYNANKKKPKDSKPRKSSSKSTNTSNFFVVNSTGIHVGTVNNFNYCSEERKSKSHENVIPRSDEINRVLNSKVKVNKEHIDMVATHLGLAWRDVGLELGFSCGQLDHFYQDNREQGCKEVVYQMLLDWSREKAERAILGDLTSVLWNLGQKYIVKELVALL